MTSKQELQRRISKLTGENEELGDDIEKLRGALDTHHSLQARDRASVKGMLRNEIGGSIWAHGHPGRIHNYRSPQKEPNQPEDAKPDKSVASQKKINNMSKKNGLPPKRRPVSSSLNTKPGRSEHKGPPAGDNLDSLGPSVSKIAGQKSESVQPKHGGTQQDRKKSVRGKQPSGEAKSGDVNTRLKEPAGAAPPSRHGSGVKSSGQKINLNETYTKESSGDTFPYVLPSPDPPECLDRKESEDSAVCSQKRAKVLKKMIKKLDVDMRLGEYRTSETDSDSLSTPRHKETVAMPTEVKSARYCDPDVMAWLLNQNLKDTEKYARIFAEHEVDMESLTLMTEPQLREMGVSALGALSKLVSAITALRRPAYKPSARKSVSFENQVAPPSGGIGPPYKPASSVEDEELNRPFQKTHNGKSKKLNDNVHAEIPVSNNPRVAFEQNAHLSVKQYNDHKTNSKKETQTDSVLSPPGRATGDSGKPGGARKAPSKPRPQSAIVTSSSRQNPAKAGSRSRPLSAHTPKTDRAVTNGARLNHHLKGSSDNVNSPEEGSPKEISSQHMTQGAALSDLISVRSFGASKINESRANKNSIPPKADAEKPEPELRLQEVEEQISELQQELSSPAAMQIISRLKGQIKDIQKEILVKKTNSDRNIHHTSDVSSESSDGVPPPQVKSSRTPRGQRSVRKDVPSYRADLTNPPPRPSDTDPHIPAGLHAGPMSKTVGASVASMSMSKTELLREVRKQKDQHRKQVRHLESELSRLKYKDPVRNCEISEDDITYNNRDVIGEGAFSEVFRGSYQGSEVAVKRLKVPLSSQDKNYFAAEVSLLRDLRHPRVVLLLGVCTTAHLPLMVLEYMSRGSLYNHLHDPSRPSLDHAAYYQIAKDMALGMNYLHRHQPTVLHLDLKSMNVLLTAHLRAKIADFGFSKLRHEADQAAKKQPSQKSTGQGHLKGTPAWMAPELLNTGQVSTKCDVYSYSIILWEMLMRKHPYKGCSMFQVIENTRTNKRLEIPDSCPRGLRDLIASCWNSNPARRPPFKDILSHLDNLQLPGDWRTLFEKAGIPKAALENVESTRTLIDFVSLTLDDLEAPKRPDDVPALQLVFSDDRITRGHLFDLDDSDEDEDDWEDITEDDEDSSVDLNSKRSQQSKYVIKKLARPSDVPSLDLNLSGGQAQIKASKTFRKDIADEPEFSKNNHADVNDSSKPFAEETLKPPSHLPPPPPLSCPVPPPPPPVSHSVNKTSKLKCDVRESFLDQLQSALHDRPSLADIHPLHSDDAIKPNGQKAHSDLNLRSSQLLSQKKQLKSIHDPHPCQLSDLHEVPQETIKNLFDILKKAVSQRRIQMGQDGESWDSGTSQRGWSVEEC